MKLNPRKSTWTWIRNRNSQRTSNFSGFDYIWRWNCQSGNTVHIHQRKGKADSDKLFGQSDNWWNPTLGMQSILIKLLCDYITSTLYNFYGGERKCPPGRRMVGTDNLPTIYRQYMLLIDNTSTILDHPCQMGQNG